MFSKKKKTQLQIENSGFVKTCDEHVPSDENTKKKWRVRTIQIIQTLKRVTKEQETTEICASKKLRTRQNDRISHI